jgi:hypothetical protein
MCPSLSENIRHDCLNVQCLIIHMHDHVGMPAMLPAFPTLCEEELSNPFSLHVYFLLSLSLSSLVWR